jgi:hypothetical protein
MPAAKSRSSEEAAAVESAAGYLASEPHYLSVASRILTALSGEGRLVPVASDPPPDPQLLCQALRKVAGQRHKVIGIPCGPELTGADVSRAGSVVATLPAGGGTVASPETVETDAPLFVFDEADRLSDRQLDEIWATIQRSARQRVAGVLLAHRGFLARLEEPSRRSLKQALAPRFRFDEIGEDERIDFLRHQLAARYSEDETRRTRPVLFRGLAALGVLAAVAVGAFSALHYVRMADVKGPGGRSVSPAGTAMPGAAPPQPESPNPQAAPAGPVPPPPRPEQIPQPNAFVATPAAPSDAEAPQGPPAPVQPPASQQLSQPEIAALVTRGDAFLTAGDIVSARSFYERAANAGDGAAALRLGATYDPNFLGRAGVRGNPGDPAEAAAWYRRARDLGDAAAAKRLKNLDR